MFGGLRHWARERSGYPRNVEHHNLLFQLKDFLRSLHGMVHWNRIVAGFANTKERILCNAKFLTVGEDIFVVATQPINNGEEVFVFYKHPQLEASDFKELRLTVFPLDLTL